MFYIPKYVNLIGQKFGRLTVIKRVGSNHHGQSQWLCSCDCGNKNEIVVVGSSLTSGHTKSCGCLNIEKFIERTKKHNRYDLCGEYGIGYTTNTNNQFYFDLEDYDKIKNYCWRENDKGYIISHINGKDVRMHKLFVDGEFIDHINHNTRDNRKFNLRSVINSQNQMNAKLRSNNSSGVTGVYWQTKTKKWVATIMVNKNRIQLGSFDNFDDAVKARKDAEDKYFGEYSYHNSQTA